MSAYDNESYLASLAASRRDVDRHVQNTLAEVGRQQGVAEGQVRQIDPAVSSIFGQGRETVQRDVNELQSAVQGASFGMDAGIPKLDPGLTLAALNQQQAGFTAATPLLRQGFQEQGMQRRGRVDNIAAGLRADIEGKRNEYIARRDAEERQKAFEAAQAAQARAAQENMLRAQIEAAQRAQSAMLQAQAQEAERQRAFAAQQSGINRNHLALIANPPPPPPPPRHPSGNYLPGGYYVGNM